MRVAFYAAVVENSKCNDIGPMHRATLYFHEDQLPLSRGYHNKRKIPPLIAVQLCLLTCFSRLMHRFVLVCVSLWLGWISIFYYKYLIAQYCTCGLDVTRMLLICTETLVNQLSLFCLQHVGFLLASIHPRSSFQFFTRECDFTPIKNEAPPPQNNISL